MSDTIVADIKTCAKCKQVKPASEFYPRSRQPQFTVSECKACMLERSKNAVKPVDGVSKVEGERAVMAILAAEGIPSSPGRDLSKKRVDVVAWGCVNIEVKSSRPHKNGSYVFALTPKQKQDGILGDLVVLICKSDTGNTYHVFSVNHPIFYNEGERKGFVVYTPNPKHRKDTRRGKLIVPLTTQLMREHENSWRLIEEERLRKSELLRLSQHI